MSVGRSTGLRLGSQLEPEASAAARARSNSNSSSARRPRQPTDPACQNRRSAAPSLRRPAIRSRTRCSAIRPTSQAGTWYVVSPFRARVLESPSCARARSPDPPPSCIWVPCPALSLSDPPPPLPVADTAACSVGRPAGCVLNPERLAGAILHLALPSLARGRLGALALSPAGPAAGVADGRRRARGLDDIFRQHRQR